MSDAEPEPITLTAEKFAALLRTAADDPGVREGPLRGLMRNAADAVEIHERIIKKSIVHLDQALHGLKSSQRLLIAVTVLQVMWIGLAAWQYFK